LVFKARLRPLAYAWLPINLKVRLRQLIRRW
jgi:hypothetical protein